MGEERQSTDSGLSVGQIIKQNLRVVPEPPMSPFIHGNSVGSC